MHRPRRLLFSPLFALLLLISMACGDASDAPSDAVAEAASQWMADNAPPPSLEIVAESQRQWTGVAAAAGPDGGTRLFVNYPRWSDDVPVSVAELVAGDDGQLRPVPYPDEAWNAWTPGGSPQDQFVCVQAVYADGSGSLWILDPANPQFGGVVTGGPKLVQVDLETNEIVRIYPFSEEVAPQASYLNDVRIDLQAGVAFLSESGTGSLVVLDLGSGVAYRALADHPSADSEGVTLTLGGSEWLQGGEAPEIHADGIALSADRQWIYYQALTGRTLYRVPTLALRAVLANRNEEQLAAAVEVVGEVGASDGILFVPGEGEAWSIYLSSLEHDAVRRWNPEEGVSVVVQDERLAWPDSFALSPDGDAVYVTTAQIHRGATPSDPYRLWRVTPLP